MNDTEAAVADEAVQWWLELRDTPATPERLAAWRIWRANDPANERAWQRIESISDQMAAIPLPLATAALAAPNVIKRQQLRMLAALVVAVGGVAATQRTPWWRAASADASTSTGEIRTIALPDGGSVALNTGSAVNLHYDMERRVLNLVRGEILVQTAADAADRPLLVRTHDGSARAIGARFTVRQHTAFSQIGVLQGHVELWPADALGPTLLLHAQQQASFSRQVNYPPARLDQGAGAWLDGMLVVSSMRLDVFLTELSRYRQGHLGCDPAIAHLRVSGAYPLSDIDRVLGALTSSLPVELQFCTRYWVQVRRRKNR